MRLLLVVLIMARRLFSVARMPRGRAAFAHRGAIQFLLVDHSIHLWLVSMSAGGQLSGGTMGHRANYELSEVDISRKKEVGQNKLRLCN